VKEGETAPKGEENTISEVIEMLETAPEVLKAVNKESSQKSPES